MKFQKISNKNFKKLIQDKRKTLTEKSGRYKSDEGVEKKILKDIFKKISPIDKNKSFLDNAPKSVVIKEKNSLSQYNIELKKLNSILNSIKN